MLIGTYREKEFHGEKVESSNDSKIFLLFLLIFSLALFYFKHL